MNVLRGYFTVLALLSCFGIEAQPPSDNPYASFYHLRGHWTDSLRWNNITVVNTIPQLADTRGNIDSTLLHNAMKTISEHGGGVLYFPAGKYYFNFDVKMQEGVILRGEDPMLKVAKDSSFCPSTHFIFPRYEPSTTGLGTPNHTAFKKIYIDSRRDNHSFGVVFVDINRACLDFYTNQGHNKVIIFGVRENNVARQEHDLPSEVQIKGGHGWQRWPSPLGNMLVAAKDKCVISNCRLNDAITDNFGQLNYMTNEGYIFKEPVLFNYSYHMGISIHRRSKLIIPGVEVRDNYIYCSRYYPIVENYGVAIDIRGNELAFPKEEPQHFQILKDHYAQPFAEEMNHIFEQGQYIKGSDTIRYQLLKPEHVDPRKKYPLFVFLHGNGEKEKGSYRLKHF